MIQLSHQIQIPPGMLPEPALTRLRKSLSFTMKVKAEGKSWKAPMEEKPFTAYIEDMHSGILIPKGFASKLERLLQEFRVAPDLKAVCHDTTVAPAAPFEPIGTSLPGHLSQHLSAICKRRYGILVAPHNCGREELVAARVAEAKTRTLIVTRTRPAAHAWAEAITKHVAGFPPGMLGDGNKDLDADILIAIDRTLYRHITDPSIQQRGLVILDGLDTASLRFVRLAGSIPARNVLGISATAYRKDKLWPAVEAIVGPVILSLTVPMERGLGEVILHPTNYEEPVRDGIEWREIVTALLADPTRTERITEDVLAYTARDRTKAIVFADRRTWLEDMAARMTGRKTAVITGDTSQRNLESSLRDFGEGRIDILFATHRSAEKLTGQRADHVFLCSPCSDAASLTRMFAMVNWTRNRRRADGKQEVVHCVLHDYTDQGAVFGKGIRFRIRLYRQLGAIRVHREEARHGQNE